MLAQNLLPNIVFQNQSLQYICMKQTTLNNKTEAKIKQNSSIPIAGDSQLQTNSIGVGDFPIKQPRMQWMAIFMEGKYYLADPLSIKRLQQIQSQIELEKKLAQVGTKGIYQKAESQKQAVAQKEEYSFASEVDPKRRTKNQQRAAQQLQRQEQLLAQRLANKKQFRKVKNNLIELNNHDEHLRSEKGKEEAVKEQTVKEKCASVKSVAKKSQADSGIKKQKAVQGRPRQKLVEQQKVQSLEVVQRAGHSFFDRLGNNLLELEDNINRIQNQNQPLLQQQQEPNQSNPNVNESSDFKIIQAAKLQPSNHGSASLDHAVLLSYLQKEINSSKNSQFAQQAQLSRTNKKTVRLSVTPAILNYQIVQSVNSSSTFLEQKYRLGEQINFLKQVIGQLRVQKLKYQINQGSGVNHQESTPPVGHYANQKQQLLGSPQQERIDHSVVPNNFTESVVTQFIASPHKALGRTLSGKIIKNTPVRLIKIQQDTKQVPQQPKSLVEQKQQSDGVQPTHDNQLSNAVSLQAQLIATTPQKKNKTATQNSEQLALLQAEIESKVFSKPSKMQEQIEPMKSFHREDANLIIPLASKQQQVQSDMQSSMPRPLLKNPRQQPPSFVVKEHRASKKQERTENKKILGNFQQFNKLSNNNAHAASSQSQVDPKRRAAKDGLIKAVESKIALNSKDKQLGEHSNLKQKIYEVEQSRKSNTISYRSEANRGNSQSNKGYRLRRQSQSSRNSRVSHSTQSNKASAGKNSNAPNVYVPALSRVQKQKDSYKQQDPLLYSLTAKKVTVPISSTIQLKSRDKSFSPMQIPKLPETPSASVTAQQMVELLKQIDSSIGLQLGQGGLQRLVMKKYKNCIMFDLHHPKGCKMVWHYSGKVYVGQWDEAAMSKAGKGEQYVPQKYYYKGEFQAGKRSGQGSLLQTNGHRYEGQWLNGEKHGRGKYYDQTLKLFYQGEWRQGKREGEGYMEIENQSKYEGSFLNNYRHGFGRELFFNGDSYTGNYQKGKFNGSGIYRWASGASYEGEFFQGCKHGRGRWVSEIGDNYVGQYRQDQKSGVGKYIWANGSVYEGEFQHDKKEGSGLLIYADGRQLTGTWKEGQLIQIIPQSDGTEEPLIHKKSRAYQTTTIFKVVEASAGKLTSSSLISPL